MLPNEKLLAAQISGLDRKLDRLIKRLGLEEEKSEKPKQEKLKKTAWYKFNQSTTPEVFVIFILNFQARRLKLY